MSNLTEIRTLIASKKVRWYDRFEKWFTEHYYISDPNLPAMSLYRYHLNEQSWYRYQISKGVYIKTPKEEILAIFYDWAKEDDYQTSNAIDNHALRRLSVSCRLSCIWDSGIYGNVKTIENIKDGLLDLETGKVYPHTPEYYSKFQVERHYIPEIKDIPPELAKLYSATPDRNKLHKWLVGLIHRKYEMELILMLYGKRGSGKSPLLLTLEYLYGHNMVSKTPIHKLGGKFGLTKIYDKRLNIFPDLASRPFGNNTVSVIKQVTGDIGGDVEINIKFVPAFNYPIKGFHAYGTNQLSKFEKNVVEEVESIMKRMCLIHYPKAQKRDDVFKKSLSEPELLDRIFSYLVNCEYVPLISETNLEEWIRTTQAEWMQNAEPIHRFVHEIFEYAPIPIGIDNKGMPVYHTLTINEVTDAIRDVLMGENLIVPGDLTADITSALKTMKIYRSKSRSARQYIKIKFKDKEPKVILKSNNKMPEFIRYLKDSGWKTFTLEDCETFWVGKMEEKDFFLLFQSAKDADKIIGVGNEWKLKR